LFKTKWFFYIDSTFLIRRSTGGTKNYLPKNNVVLSTEAVKEAEFDGKMEVVHRRRQLFIGIGE